MLASLDWALDSLDADLDALDQEGGFFSPDNYASVMAKMVALEEKFDDVPHGVAKKVLPKYDQLMKRLAGYNPNPTS